jgi:hypothetical protein
VERRKTRNGTPFLPFVIEQLVGRRSVSRAVRDDRQNLQSDGIRYWIAVALAAVLVRSAGRPLTITPPRSTALPDNGEIAQFVTTSSKRIPFTGRFPAVAANQSWYTRRETLSGMKRRLAKRATVVCVSMYRIHSVQGDEWTIADEDGEPVFAGTKFECEDWLDQQDNIPPRPSRFKSWIRRLLTGWIAGSARREK